MTVVSARVDFLSFWQGIVGGLVIGVGELLVQKIKGSNTSMKAKS